MKVCIIGLGYIGLPLSLMMAAHGVSVIAVDQNENLVNKLRNGQITSQEKGLDELFTRASEKEIIFTTECAKTKMYIIAVPTPYDELSKKLDSNYLVKAVKDVIKVCPKGAVIVVESTVPPGTIDKYVRPIIDKAGHKIGEDIHLAHVPERIIPGNMVYELLHNSRTIGADSKEIGEQVGTVYASFCQGEIILTDIRTAEMTKVVENTFRDINIAYANELTKICHIHKMDVYEIIRIANKHPRVNILQPGPGVGGHCISVDPWFLVGDYPETAKLIHQARLINDSMPDFVLERISQIMEENDIQDLSRVGLYGLTYKEDVDDVRRSPALQMLDSMKRHLAVGIKVYDPLVERDIVENQYHDFDAFLKDIDLIVLLIGHSHIRKNMGRLNGKIILDTRHICSIKGIYTL